MPYRISCPGCSRPLQVPDEGIGRTLRCPKCGRVMMVKTQAAVEESSGLRPLSPGEGQTEKNPATRITASPPRQPISIEPAEVRVRVLRKGRIEEPGEVLERDGLPERPAKRGAVPAPRPPQSSTAEEPEVRVQVRRKARTEEDEDRPGDDDRDKRPMKRLRRRKRKRAQKSSALHLSWLPWAVGAVIVVSAVVVLAVLNLQAGHGEFLLRRGLELAIMLPISTVILLASMIISTGGFDFGDPRTALLKVPALLIVVNLVNLLAFPCGIVFAFPLWLFGLMWLFDLDLWEAKFLLLINFILNSLVRYFFLGLILTALMHAGKDKELPDQPEDRAPAPGWNTEDIIQLGGQVERDAKDPERPVVGIVLQGTAITDEDLENLRSFPQLRRLDLSNTAITDAGLINLLELTQLQSLKLTGTRVTDRGIGNLQRALPNLQITH